MLVILSQKVDSESSYEIENVTIQQNPVLKKRRIFCINVTSSQKNALSCGMIEPQSRKINERSHSHD